MPNKMSNELGRLSDNTSVSNRMMRKQEQGEREMEREIYLGIIRWISVGNDPFDVQHSNVLNRLHKYRGLE